MDTPVAPMTGCPSPPRGGARSDDPNGAVRAARIQEQKRRAEKRCRTGVPFCHLGRRQEEEDRREGDKGETECGASTIMKVSALANGVDEGR